MRTLSAFDNFVWLAVWLEPRLTSFSSSHVNGVQHEPVINRLEVQQSFAMSSDANDARLAHAKKLVSD